jgi:acyl dehydratase
MLTCGLLAFEVRVFQVRRIAPMFINDSLTFSFRVTKPQNLSSFGGSEQQTDFELTEVNIEGPPGLNGMGYPRRW